jgi:hypothetical protein
MCLEQVNNVAVHIVPFSRRSVQPRVIFVSLLLGRILAQ